MQYIYIYRFQRCRIWFIQVSSLDFLTARTRAVRYLESHLRSASTTSDPYALSIITYALTLASSSYADIAYQQLNDLAINKGVTSALIFPPNLVLS